MKEKLHIVNLPPPYADTKSPCNSSSGQLGDDNLYQPLEPPFPHYVDPCDSNNSNQCENTPCQLYKSIEKNVNENLCLLRHTSLQLSAPENITHFQLHQDKTNTNMHSKQAGLANNHLHNRIVDSTPCGHHTMSLQYTSIEQHHSIYQQERSETTKQDDHVYIVQPSQLHTALNTEKQKYLKRYKCRESMGNIKSK